MNDEKKSPEELEKLTLQAHEDMLTRRLEKDAEVKANANAYPNEIKFNTYSDEEKEKMERDLAEVRKKLSEINDSETN